MKKSELRSGMIVENKKGKISMVLLNTFQGDVLGGMGNGRNAWAPLDMYNEDLFHADFPQCAIVKVYSPTSNMKLGSDKRDNLIWERKEEIILTMDEIAEKFGVSVECLKIQK